MGIGFVLLIWGIVGTILATIGALVLGGATNFFTRGVREHRRKAILAAIVFPFACLGWAAMVFVFQAVVNVALLHRDPGLGDTWTCALPNGYALLMIDVTDYGWVYNPKTQGSSGVVGEQEDAIAGVRLVQVSGQRILGGSDSQAFRESRDNEDHVDSYFLLDTATGKRTNFSTYNALQNATLQLGIQPNLEHIETVYSRYRFTWFDVFVGFLLFVPPFISGSLLVLWIVRLRRERASVMQSA